MRDAYPQRWRILETGLLWIILSHLQVNHVLGIITFAIGGMSIFYALFLFIVEGAEQHEEDHPHQALPQHPCPACRNKIGTISEREKAGHRAQTKPGPGVMPEWWAPPGSKAHEKAKEIMMRDNNAT